MDDKWRTAVCYNCSGHGVVWNPESWFGAEECNTCGESGQVWLRPKGHAFAYPGGPALGWWGKDDYETGTPMMPYEWHAWSNPQDEVDEFVLNRNAEFDQDLNIIKCNCGFMGTIREHDIHAEEAKKQFILEHKQ